MNTRILIYVSAVCLCGSAAFAADKSKAVIQLDSARAALDSMSGKAAGKSEASADLDRARTAIRKGSELAEKGRQMFGFGEIRPEVEREIKNYAEIAELSTAAAGSRVERSRAAIELETLEKQLAAVRTKTRIFEDRKAELDKCKSDATRFQSAARELEALKTENAQLSARLEKQQADIRTLSSQLEDSRKAANLKERAEQTKAVKPPPAPSPSQSANEVPATLKELLPVEPAPAAEAPLKTILPSSGATP